MFTLHPTKFEIEEARASQEGIAAAEADIRKGYADALVCAKALAANDSVAVFKKDGVRRDPVREIYERLRDLVEDTLAPNYAEDVDHRKISEEVWAEAQTPKRIETPAPVTIQVRGIDPNAFYRSTVAERAEILRPFGKEE